jgi:catechol 2,3-dioxygenase-like lactoylglutathione lyase family enzyme
MNWTLEVVIVPVTDIDHAKAFYSETLGFNVDHDTHVGDDIRIVQLTPPGSGCSIVIGKGAGLDRMEPGSQHGLQLVVKDIWEAHKELQSRGAAISEVNAIGPEGMRAASRDDDLNNVGFIFFQDPDGNSWAIQQITNRM